MPKRRVVNDTWRLMLAIGACAITTSTVFAAQSGNDVQSTAAAAAGLPEGATLVVTGALIVILAVLVRRTLRERELEAPRQDLQPTPLPGATAAVPNRDLAARSNSAHAG